jgi:hypothetical protein
MANEFVSTSNFSGTNVARHENPGKHISGPTWAPTYLYDHLLLPDGRKLGDTPTEQLRPILSKLGIRDSHTRPRPEVAHDYAVLLEKIHNEAGDRAVATFLEGARHRD